MKGEGRGEGGPGEEGGVKETSQRFFTFAGGTVDLGWRGG